MCTLALVLCGLINNCTKQPAEHRVISASDPLRPSWNNGICNCPYDYAIDGSFCGDRSSWSRPGGEYYQCFAGDISGYPPAQ